MRTVAIMRTANLLWFSLSLLNTRLTVGNAKTTQRQTKPIPEGKRRSHGQFLRHHQQQHLQQQQHQESSIESFSTSLPFGRNEMEIVPGVGNQNGQFIYKWDRNYRFVYPDSSTEVSQADNHDASASSTVNANIDTGTSTSTSDRNDGNNNHVDGSSSFTTTDTTTTTTRTTTSNTNENKSIIIDNYNNSNNPPAILIVQDASPGPDEEVLYVTSQVNRAYAKRWGHDYLQFTGIAVGGSNSWQATFNKPYLLRKLIQARIENAKPKPKDCQKEGPKDDSVLEQQQQSEAGIGTAATNNTSCNIKPSIDSYDIVMFLDSSAIIVQLDYNVLSLIQSDKMIATSLSKIIEIGHNDDNNNNNDNSNGNNADVMLWNLNHPETFHISNQWIEKCIQKSRTLMNVLYKSQSEVILSKILQDETFEMSSGKNNSEGQTEEEAEEEVESMIESIPKEMVDGLQGTLVKQDMSYNSYMIDVSDLRRIMPIVTGIADSVCYRFYPQCEVVD